MNIVELVKVLLSPPVLLTAVTVVSIPSIAYVWTQRMKYQSNLILQKEKEAETIKQLTSRIEVLESIIINLEKDK